MPVFISSDKVDGLLPLDRLPRSLVNGKGAPNFDKVYPVLFKAAQAALVSVTRERLRHGHKIDAFVAPALLIRDESKRYCLPFLEENGASSEFSSFACKARLVYIVRIGCNPWYSPEDFDGATRERVAAAGEAAYLHFMGSQEVRELPEDLHIYVQLLRLPSSK
jgi:hypothetical protein